jgi:hypothetical protein
MTRVIGAVALGLAVLSLQAGCGGGDNRQPVFGKVIGAEGESGSLSLVPAGEGPSAITEIRDGAFQFDTSNGPTPGPHAAHILLAKKESPAAASDNPKVGLPQKPNETPLGRQFTVQVTVPEQAPYEVDINLNAGVSSGDRR